MGLADVIQLANSTEEYGDETEDYGLWATLACGKRSLARALRGAAALPLALHHATRAHLGGSAKEPPLHAPLRTANRSRACVARGVVAS